jgi:hypothetical protein
MDRDLRWTSDFWRGVAKYLEMKMSLSASHHSQHDSQTEIVNKQLVTVLRAYVNEDLSDWAIWLHILEFAYNSAIHSSSVFYLETRQLATATGVDRSRY